MTRDEFVQLLNEDLTAKWGTIMGYTCQAAMHSKRQDAEVWAVLREDIHDELCHAAFLAEAVVELEGKPAGFARTERTDAQLLFRLPHRGLEGGLPGFQAAADAVDLPGAQPELRGRGAEVTGVRPLGGGRRG